jgi:hypothetical protein
MNVRSDHYKSSGQRTVCPVRFCHIQLAQSKITESDMASIIQEDILRLQVTVDNVEYVEVFQCAQQFGGVESAPIFVEPTLAL